MCFKLKSLKYIRPQGQLASNVKQILTESKLWEQTICPLHLSSGQFFFNLKNFLVIEICLIFVCASQLWAVAGADLKHKELIRLLINTIEKLICVKNFSLLIDRGKSNQATIINAGVLLPSVFSLLLWQRKPHSKFSFVIKKRKLYIQLQIRKKQLAS
jgi:hypothetical protein